MVVRVGKQYLRAVSFTCNLAACSREKTNGEKRGVKRQKGTCVKGALPISTSTTATATVQTWCLPVNMSTLSIRPVLRHCTPKLSVHTLKLGSCPWSRLVVHANANASASAQKGQTCCCSLSNVRPSFRPVLVWCFLYPKENQRKQRQQFYSACRKCDWTGLLHAHGKKS